MKKVIFIFLILISCLCLAVVSCAVKEESSTDTTSTASIVDGSAEGYMKIGNMLMVWGATIANDNVSYPINFSETPSVSTGGTTSSCPDTLTVTSTYVNYGCNGSYIAIGKWQ